MKKSLLCLFFLACGKTAPATSNDAGAITASDDVVDFARSLGNIPGVTILSSTQDADGTVFYALQYTQLVDHDDPSRGTYSHYFNIVHKSADAPVVLYTDGYGAAPYEYLYEPTELLGANQIEIEHRFYGSSWPSTTDYSTATIHQSVEDLHTIVRLLKPLYKNKWVSTGISKDGMTATYYRAAYPNDVDATIAYSAPLMLPTIAPTNPLDQRMNYYLDQAGSKDCRANLTAFRRAVLQEPMKSQLLALMAADAQANGLTYTMLAPDSATALDHAFEYTVIELNYGIWQYENEDACDAVPTGDFAASDAFAYLLNQGTLEFYSDQYSVPFETFYYEALTQLSYYEEYYGPDDTTDVIADLLDFSPSWNDWAPPGVPLVYDSSAMAAMQKWQEHECDRVIFIYGDNDPYAQAAYEPGAWTNCQEFVATGGSHGTGIYNIYGAGALDADQQAALASTLQAWTGLVITPPAATSTPETSGMERARFTTLQGRRPL